MPRFTLIDNDHALHRLLAQLEDANTLAIDTEFLREKTYYPRLCLIQVCSGSQVACIDPLAISDLNPLWRVLLDPARLKVLHAAKQDLEVIYQACGEVPSPIFDTQIAAALCGYGDQTGYAALAKDLLDVELDKSLTRMDWSRRPLPTDALEYAADDVRHLYTIWEMLVDKLEELGRQHWLAPEMDALIDPAQYRTEPADAWRRLRTARKLKPKQVAVLQTLAEWREEEAMRRNRPRGWLLKDDALIFMAQRPPQNYAELANVRGVDAKTIERHSEELLERIETARKTPPPADLPEDKARLSATQEAQVDMLMSALKMIAENAKLSPASIGTRKDLERLVRGDMNSPVLQGWRRAAAGERLLEVLSGKLALRTEGDRIRFEG